MIGKIMMWVLLVLAIFSICLGSILVFDASESVIVSVSRVNITAGLLLENFNKYLIKTINKNRGIDLIYFGITWLALAYLGIKANKKGGERSKFWVG